jgi:hypothetical protein
VSWKWSLSFRFPHQSPVCIFLLPAFHMPHPSHSPWLGHSHNICWGVSVMTDLRSVRETRFHACMQQTRVTWRTGRIMNCFLLCLMQHWSSLLSQLWTRLVVDTAFAFVYICPLPTKERRIWSLPVQVCAAWRRFSQRRTAYTTVVT